MPRGKIRNFVRNSLDCWVIFVVVPHRSTSPNASHKSSVGRKFTLSARTCCTPAPTRSTTRSARFCSPAAWAKPASLRRPAPVSMASPRLQPPRDSDSSARFTWARWTWNVRPSMSPACVFSERKSSASLPARPRSRRRSTKPCATGSPMSATPTTSWAARLARIRIP